MQVIRLVLGLGSDDLARLVRPQLLRAATGVATNYRAACRGRSRREFAARLGVANEEADESEFWLDVLEEFRKRPEATIRELRREAAELRAIFASSRATTLEGMKRRRASK